MVPIIEKNLAEEYKQKTIIEYMKFFEKLKDDGLYSLPDYMEVTASIKILENNFDSKIMEYGFHGKFFNRQYDVKNVKNQLADINFKLTDFVTQYREAHSSILTKKTDYLMALTEIYINLQFIFITLFVLFLIAVITIMNNKFNVSEGIMDIVSMSLSMGIISPILPLGAHFAAPPPLFKSVRRESNTVG
ncbi:Protein of unknown function [Cotesia congregata]|uniref:Uncharacterized protein n=1 Tax=Cotesia congregata TaxID=51543 RepID=A0A8J2HN68_COTCN|nr:Protein of unknown function [Cotesia congregata]